MNKLCAIIAVLFLINGCRKGETIEPEFYSCNFNFQDSSSILITRYQGLLNEIVSEGVTGIMMSVYKPSSGMG
ncbi:MAG: hypothetical protein IPP25_11630 [Saprospiraceae bacterium]|nr:hypothetical protein [Candidatus Opimibacter skivensis]